MLVAGMVVLICFYFFGYKNYNIKATLLIPDKAIVYTIFCSFVCEIFNAKTAMPTAKFFLSDTSLLVFVFLQKG